MKRTPSLQLAVLALGWCSAAWAQPPGSIGRGELLYTTHCDACHTQQMHWREKKAVTNWATLTAQVRRWQANAGRSWDKGDTADLACYLDANFYRLAPGRGGCVQ
ncbi:MAG: cytochrome C [Actinomycetota bacterium]